MHAKFAAGAGLPRRRTKCHASQDAHSMPSQARIHVAGASKRPKLLRHLSSSPFPLLRIGREEGGRTLLHSRDSLNYRPLHPLHPLHRLSMHAEPLHPLSIHAEALTQSTQERCQVKVEGGVLCGIVEKETIIAYTPPRHHPHHHPHYHPHRHPPPNHKCIGQAHSCIHSQNNAVASVSNISIDLDFIAPLW